MRPYLCGVRGDIGGEPEEHGVAEGEKASETQHHVERAGEQREAKHLRENVRVKTEPGQHRQEDGKPGHQDGVQESGPAPAAAYRARRNNADLCRIVDARHQLVFPKRPAGLIKRTMAMITKMTVEAACG